MLAYIDAPHFFAGLVFDEGDKVVEAAPIIRYMVGWSRARVRTYAASKGWKARIVPNG